MGPGANLSYCSVEYTGGRIGTGNSGDRESSRIAKEPKEEKTQTMKKFGSNNPQPPYTNDILNF